MGRKFKVHADKSQAQEAADALHVSLPVVAVGSPDELEQAFSAIANAHADVDAGSNLAVYFFSREIGLLNWLFPHTCQRWLRTQK